MEVISGCLLIEITAFYGVFSPTTVLQRKKKSFLYLGGIKSQELEMENEDGNIY